MDIDSNHSTVRTIGRPLIGALVLFFVELLVIGVAFKHGINFHCLSNWPSYACGGPSGTLIAIYCVCAAVALFAFLFPEPFVRLFDRAGEKTWPLILNIVGTSIALVPITFLEEGTGTASLVPALAFWSVGMVGILSGLLLFLAPFERWVEFISEQKWRLVPLVFAGLTAPALATFIRPLWQLDTIASATFSAVSYMIKAFGYEVTAFPETRVIGANDFFIDIAPVCSGVEGIALVTIFVTLYLALLKSDLRFPRALILYPIGIIISAALNVVRIVALLAIGLNGNPELAVGGFHSHAGWLMFTIVSLGIIAAANTIGWLRKTETAGQAPILARSQVPPFFQDRTVSMLLPFAVFMFSALLAQVFSQTPGVIYPLRAVLMAAALLLFLPLYRTLDWRLDPIALAIGAAIGLMWILIPVAEPETDPPYGSLAGGLLFLWFVARGIGTIFFVPMIEELFFRGYLERKFKQKNSVPWAVGSAVAVAILFAVLHGRWAEAFVASLALSYVMHRSGRFTDAIIAHGVANTIVFVVAAITRQVHII